MKTSILLLALLSSQAFARGGDGGAFNGPTLSPISVPAQADHPITDADIEGATKICLFKGDAANGVTSVVQNLMKQVYPGAKLRYPAFTGRVAQDDTQGSVPKSNFWKASAGYAVDRVNSVPMKLSDITGEDLEYLALDSSTALVHVYISDDGQPVKATDSPDTNLVANGNLPYVTADYNYQYLFDKWGKVVKTTKIMSNVRIITDGQDLSFTNAETGRAVPLEISAKDYAQCLQGELQNLAAKH